MRTCLIGVGTTSLMSVLIDKGQTPICLYLVYENLAFVIVGSIDQLTLVIDRDIAEWSPLFNNVIERLKISCKACDSSFSLFRSDTVEVAFFRKSDIGWIVLICH